MTKPAGASARAARRHRVAPEVHAVRTGGQRDVEPIVDEHTCACPACGVETTRDETGECASIEIALADLNEIDAGSGRGADRGDERIVASLAEAPPIGDHADNRAHGRGSVSSTLLRRPVSA
jgi:hypothetical protein